MTDDAKLLDSKKPWIKLCEQASVEQDPERLIELAQAITAMLEEEDQQTRAKLSGVDANRRREEA